MKFELIDKTHESFGIIDLPLTPKPKEYVEMDDVLYHVVNIVHCSGTQKLQVIKRNKTESLGRSTLL